MGGTAYDAAVMDAISHKVTNWMLNQNREERKSLLQIAIFFKTLPIEAARAQRPLVELSIAFNPTA